MSTPSDSVRATARIRKLKRPVGSGVWATYVLDEDEFGTWLFTPAGSLYRGEDGRSVATCEVGLGRPVMHLIPADAWWMSAWTGANAELPIAVEICRPPTMVDGEWRFVDLELDPYRRVDGTVGTDDWDEFRDAYAAGAISRPEHDAARDAAAWIERHLTERVEPFGSIGVDRLAAAIDLRLPPLVDLDDAPLFVRENSLSGRSGSEGRP